MPIVKTLDPNRSYTLDDLAHWPQTGTHLAVLGFPVRHSISPAMHNAALEVISKRDKQFADWCYFKFEVDPKVLPEALERMHAAGFMGLNLTVPHKVDAVQLLQDIDAEALEMGAVNTLRRTKTGWKGFNTDGYGIEKALSESLGVGLKDSTVILIGAGGAARATAVQCLRSKCEQLWLINRTEERAEQLRRDLVKIYPEYTHRIQVHTPQALCELVTPAILIQGTSLGLQSEDALPLNPALLQQGQVVFDMIYNPSETAFMRAAQERGLAAVNGLGMLVWQGVRALEIWTETQVSVEVMQAAALDALRSSG